MNKHILVLGDLYASKHVLNAIVDTNAKISFVPIISHESAFVEKRSFIDKTFPKGLHPNSTQECSKWGQTSNKTDQFYLRELKRDNSRHRLNRVSMNGVFENPILSRSDNFSISVDEISRCFTKVDAIIRENGDVSVTFILLSTAQLRTHNGFIFLSVLFERYLNGLVIFKDSCKFLKETLYELCEVNAIDVGIFHSVLQPKVLKSKEMIILPLFETKKLPEKHLKSLRKSGIKIYSAKDYSSHNITIKKVLSFSNDYNKSVSLVPLLLWLKTLLVDKYEKCSLKDKETRRHLCCSAGYRLTPNGAFLTETQCDDLEELILVSYSSKNSILDILKDILIDRYLIENYNKLPCSDTLKVLDKTSCIFNYLNI